MTGAALESTDVSERDHLLERLRQLNVVLPVFAHELAHTRRQAAELRRENRRLRAELRKLREQRRIGEQL
jgi:hypothetical protein